MKGKLIWYLIINIILASIMFYLGTVATAAASLVFKVIGIAIILYGISVLFRSSYTVTNGEISDNLGAKLFFLGGCALIGYAAIQFSDGIAEKFEVIVPYVSAAIYVFLGIWQLKTRLKENELLDTFQKWITYSYPTIMILSGALTLASPFIGAYWAWVAGNLLSVACGLWIFRTVWFVVYNWKYA